MPFAGQFTKLAASLSRRFPTKFLHILCPAAARCVASFSTSCVHPLIPESLLYFYLGQRVLMSLLSPMEFPPACVIRCYRVSFSARSLTLCLPATPELPGSGLPDVARAPLLSSQRVAACCSLRDSLGSSLFRYHAASLSFCTSFVLFPLAAWLAVPPLLSTLATDTGKPALLLPWSARPHVPPVAYGASPCLRHPVPSRVVFLALSHLVPSRDSWFARFWVARRRTRALSISPAHRCIMLLAGQFRRLSVPQSRRFPKFLHVFCPVAPRCVASFPPLLSTLATDTGKPALLLPWSARPHDPPVAYGGAPPCLRHPLPSRVVSLALSKLVPSRDSWIARFWVARHRTRAFSIFPARHCMMLFAGQFRQLSAPLMPLP